MKKQSLLLLAVMLMPLIGCQQVAQKKHEYVRNRGKDYLTSVVIAPLEIPPELCHPTTTENFPVPEMLPPLGSVARVSMVPPGFGVISEPVEAIETIESTS